jgi:tripartite-type tricarboxylate transporter receptor subunit TctC
MFRTVLSTLLSALSALFVLCGLPASAAGYPEKPIRLIIPFSAGGGTDVLARAISNKLERTLGGSIIIDNRGGAGGTLGTAIAASAPADGYTLLFTSASYVVNPSLYKKLPFDPIKDFTPITIFASTPHILVVHPSLPVKSVKELLALARSRPGELFYSSGGHGSSVHLASALFTHMAKLKLTHVPYKGGGPAMISLISGEVQVMLPGLQPAFPHLKSGRMRGLAVSTKKRAPALPNIPTLDQSGVPGYEKDAWFGLLAPAGVPDPIIDQLYAAVAKTLKDPDLAKRLKADGATPVANTPADFKKFVSTRIAFWRRLISEMKM